MVIAFLSIILLYVVTVTVAIVNVETISSRMEAIYADQFANVQSSLRMTASLRAVGRNIAILAATEGLVDEDAYLQNTRELIRDEEAALSELSTGYIHSASLRIYRIHWILSAASAPLQMEIPARHNTRN